MSKIRAAIYTRVSTDDQVENTSLAAQEADCRQRCAAEGWQVVEVFEDPGVSGGLREAERPAFHRMMEACRSGLLDQIVVVDPDRFSRDALYGETARRELVDLKVDLTFTRTGDITDFEFAIRGIFAQQERAKIRERMMRGIEAAVAEGHWPGGPPPYGYCLVPSANGRHTDLAVDEDERAALLAGVTFLVDDGMTTGQTAAALNRLGYQPRRATHWTAHNLRRTYLDAFLTGTWIYRRGRDRRQTSPAPPVQLSIPAVLSEARHRQLLDVLSSSSTSRSVSAKYLLSHGRLVAPCGGHYSGIIRPDGKTRQYRCNGSVGPDRCHCFRLSADLVEQAAWGAIIDLLSKPDRLRAFAQDYIAKQSTHQRHEADQLRHLDKSIAELRRTLTTGMAKYIKADLDPVAIASAFRDIQAELDAKEAHRERLVGWERDSQALSNRVDQLAALAATASQRLGSMPYAKRLSLVELLDLKVSVTAWSDCPECLGKGKVKGGTGGIPCSECRAMKRLPHLLVEGRLVDRLTPAQSCEDIARLHAVPFALEAS